jgi:hypothetical protein
MVANNTHPAMGSANVPIMTATTATSGSIHRARVRGRGTTFQQILVKVPDSGLILPNMVSRSVTQSHARERASSELKPAVAPYHFPFPVRPPIR